MICPVMPEDSRAKDNYGSDDTLEARQLGI